MIRFLTLEPKSFGLDFSDLSLKIINLRKKGRFFDLDSWGEIKMEPGVIEEGEIKNKEVLIENIKKSLAQVKGKRLKLKDVIASLPEKYAFLQVIKMPKMNEKELETAVPYEAENYIPFSIEEVYLDFEVIAPLKGYSEKNLDILIAAIPKNIVDPYVYCLKKAGLSPRALEIESQSISRALIKNGVSSSPLLLVDFGRSRTSLIIFFGRSLLFTSSIPISSFNLTESISKYFNIDLAQAEKIKLKYGLQVFSKNQLDKKEAPPKTEEKKSRLMRDENDDIIKAMAPVLNSLIKEIKKYLDYYQNHSSNNNSFSESNRIERIILCGRGANLMGLDDFLSFHLKIPVKLGNPWINILPFPLKQVPNLSFKESLGYTSALGLALRGINLES